ncbi:MAG: hypothetical protein ACE5RN_03970 [Nitrosopumilaceae archaeon]
MSRWDDANFDNDRFDLNSDNEEVRLLKKFEGYKKLEKLELEKRIAPESVNSKKLGFFSRGLHTIMVIQGIIITAFTMSLMLIEFSVESKLSILSLVTVILSVEIVLISIYLRKKSISDVQKNSLTTIDNKSEFARI